MTRTLQCHRPPGRYLEIFETFLRRCACTPLTYVIEI